MPPCITGIIIELINDLFIVSINLGYQGGQGGSQHCQTCVTCACMCVPMSFRGGWRYWKAPLPVPGESKHDHKSCWTTQWPYPQEAILLWKEPITSHFE